MKLLHLLSVLTAVAVFVNGFDCNICGTTFEKCKSEQASGGPTAARILCKLNICIYHGGYRQCAIGGECSSFTQKTCDSEVSSIPSPIQKSATKPKTTWKVSRARDVQDGSVTGNLTTLKTSTTRGPGVFTSYDAATVTNHAKPTPNPKCKVCDDELQACIATCAHDGEIQGCIKVCTGKTRCNGQLAICRAHGECGTKCPAGLPEASIFASNTVDATATATPTAELSISAINDDMHAFSKRQQVGQAWQYANDRDETSGWFVKIILGGCSFWTPDIPMGFYYLASGYSITLYE
jgi:hypothetical protein